MTISSNLNFQNLESIMTEEYKYKKGFFNEKINCLKSVEFF